MSALPSGISGIGRLLRMAFMGTERALQLRLFNHPEIMNELRAGASIAKGEGAISAFKNGLNVKMVAKGGASKTVFVDLASLGGGTQADALWAKMEPILNANPLNGAGGGMGIGDAAMSLANKGELNIATKSPLLSRAAAKYGQTLRKAPLATAAGTLAVGGFLGEQAVDAYDNHVGLLDREIETTFQEDSNARLQALRTERLQQSAAANEVALAQRYPQLYNEVMSGRRLPRGAVVFGGQARRDLMEELTTAMASGRLQAKPTLEQQALASL